MDDFKEQVVIITGASSGIGREMALQLAEKGAWLSLASRQIKLLEKVAEECIAKGGRAVVVATDLAEEAQCERLIEETVRHYGKIDVLINNAGITMWTKFENMKVLSPYKNIMEVNFLGSVYCTHYALPYLMDSKGRIVAISSVAGKIGLPFRSGYSASKFAMNGFFETIRIELQSSGVSVTVAVPDYVRTDSRLQAFGPDGEILKSRPNRPGKRMMSVEKAAEIILDAALKRKREVIMSARGKIALILKTFFPALVDKVAKKAVDGDK